MKKFLPKRKTERKASDEEFVIRKSKCWIFLFFSVVSLCSVISTGLWEQPFLWRWMWHMSKPTCCWAWEAPARAAFPRHLQIPSELWLSSSWFLLWDHVALGGLVATKPRDYVKTIKSCTRSAHQMCLSWDKLLPVHAVRSWSHFHRAQENKNEALFLQRCSPAKKDVLTATWSQSGVFLGRGRGERPVVRCCSITLRLLEVSTELGLGMKTSPFRVLLCCGCTRHPQGTVTPLGSPSRKTVLPAHLPVLLAPKVRHHPRILLRWALEGLFHTI